MNYQRAKSYVSSQYYRALGTVKGLVEGVSNFFSPDDGLVYAVANSISYAKNGRDSRAFEFIPPSKPLKKSDKLNGGGIAPKPARGKNLNGRHVRRIDIGYQSK